MSFIKFGQYVRARRESLGLTQEQVAERVGITLTSMNKIENARVTDMKVSHLYKLASVLKWDAQQVHRAFHGKDPYTGVHYGKAPAIKKAINDFLKRLDEIEADGL